MKRFVRNSSLSFNVCPSRLIFYENPVMRKSGIEVRDCSDKSFQGDFESYWFVNF